MNDKIKELNNTNKINIMCLGIQNRPPSLDFLKDLFVNFDDLNINIIARNLDKYEYKCPNVYKFELCSTFLMFELIKKSHYVLCLDNPLNPEPIMNSISAAIPKALSYGCRLIIPEIWQSYYNFKSIITYKDNYLQKNGNTKLILDKYTNIEVIYNELYNYVSHKNRIFDEIINLKILLDTNLKLNKSLNTIYSNIINNIYLEKPNILVDKTTNLNLNDISILSLDFREIHCNLNIKLNNCNIYNNINYNYILEPILFILDINNSDIINDLKLLSNRNFNDILIFNNIKNDNNIREIITKYYNKYFFYYIYENILILISQK
jgi:hypothetical protein